MRTYRTILLVSIAAIAMPAMAEPTGHPNAGTQAEPDAPSPATRSPEPLNSPGAWVTPQDYPPQALRENVEGVVAFQLGISPAGTITDCNIGVSSGSAVLDQTTCQLIRLRALFRPALVAGEPAAGTYSNRVRWVIPRPRKPVAGEMVISFEVGPDGTIADCRVEKTLGGAALNAQAKPEVCRVGRFDGGYSDQAGQPVARRVRTTVKVEVLPIP